MIRRVFVQTETGAKEISNKEPNAPIESPADLSNVRQIRYTKSSGFTSTNSTTPVVLASIPLGSISAMEGKRLHLLSLVEKDNANGLVTLEYYIHDATLTPGTPYAFGAGAQLATYTSSANTFRDHPFERSRMFVRGGSLFVGWPAMNFLNDSVAMGRTLTERALPSTPHIILMGSVQNSADTITPQFISLEY